MLKKGVFWALHMRHLQNGTAPPPGPVSILKSSIEGTMYFNFPMQFSVLDFNVAG